MTPGTYLRLRRGAARLAIGEVAQRVATEPRIAEHLRAETIALIERDEAPASWATIVALRCVFPFDLQVLETLEMARLGYASQPLPICRVCGCTQDDACEGGCWWAEDDLCSSCVDPVARVDAIHAAACQGVAAGIHAAAQSAAS